MRQFLFGIRSFTVGRHRAQDVVEYGMIIATIAVVVLLGVTAFGAQIKPWFEHLAGHITTVGT
jgi:Flp pilus assembly pilin Flp